MVSFHVFSSRKHLDVSKMRNTLCTLIPILESENNELYLKSILQMSFVSVEFDFNVENVQDLRSGKLISF